MDPEVSETEQSENRIRRPRKAPSKRQHTVTVAFRLDSFYISRLERGASQYGISIHEYARQRLSELLDRQDEARVLDEMKETRSGIARLRTDLATALEVILTNTTRTDPGVIKNWVDMHLRGGEDE